MDIKALIEKHGKDKIRALIPSRPVNVYCGLIAITSSRDPAFPILCEIDEKRYKVEDGYKIGWKPIAEYASKKATNLLCDVVGFQSHTMYQNDFNSTVEHGGIQVFVKA
jgi:hypothetical protein